MGVYDILQGIVYLLILAIFVFGCWLIYELVSNYDTIWVKDLRKFLSTKASGDTDLANAIHKYLQLIKSVKA